MAIIVETRDSYGSDKALLPGCSHTIVSAAGSGRLTLALLHSVSVDNAVFSSVALSAATLTLLGGVTSLRAGLYHRLDIYHALDNVTGPAGNPLFSCVGTGTQTCVELAILTLTGVKQQVPINAGNVGAKVDRYPTPDWVGVSGSSSLTKLVVQQADPAGAALPSKKNNAWGYIPAANDSDTCQVLLYLSDSANATLFSAEY